MCEKHIQVRLMEYEKKKGPECYLRALQSIKDK